jgi:hypothetical protein
MAFRELRRRRGSAHVIVTSSFRIGRALLYVAVRTTLHDVSSNEFLAKVTFTVAVRISVRIYIGFVNAIRSGASSRIESGAVQNVITKRSQFTELNP